MKRPFDVIVIGGGVKGTAIARDAVGRGLRVLLCEQDDLGSSCVKSFAKRGLAERYAPQPIGRVEARKASRELEILRRVTPHLWRPAQEKARIDSSRALGLFERITRQKPTSHLTNAPLQSAFNDHRYVMLCARDAADRGAYILPRTRILNAVRSQHGWSVNFQPVDGKEVASVTAKIIVDTAGTFDVFSESQQMISDPGIPRKAMFAAVAIVRDSAIRKNTFDTGTTGNNYFSIDHDDDHRLIGCVTLSKNHPIDLREELLTWASDSIEQDLQVPDIIWFRQTGFTAPCDEALKQVPGFGDYTIEVKTNTGAFPVLRVKGGSVSVARKLAEDVVGEMAPYTNMIGKKWTRTAPLPGGDFQIDLREALVEQLQSQYPFLDAAHSKRLFENYGTEAATILNGAVNCDDLGRDFGAGLFEAEVRWLLDNEWARTAEDIVWRRTHLGLQMTPAEVSDLQNWIVRH
ncbi:MAG: FAD-dependent oxidoreductase [Rhodobacteraceae bacterium]|nr:FAD-dependent oxidoreductase [Paracoccaceae bacterium]